MMLRTARQTSFWNLAIALLVAVQLALALHSSAHRFGDSIAAPGDGCTLCQVASTMAPGPGGAVATPVFIASAAPAVPLQPLAHLDAPAAAFHPRAPPVLISL